jgi:fibronectin type 3 domain-containing protein
VEFNNLEQYLVKIYSDSSQMTLVAEIGAKSTKKIEATPNLSGTAFYPTFFLDLFNMPDIVIPYNGPAIIVPIEEGKTNPVYIPALESINISSAYIKIINNSLFSLTLRQGENIEKSPIGGGSNITAANKSAVYEVNPGPSSGYSILHNTNTPITFPENLTEFRQGLIYVFTYNGTTLSYVENSVLQTIPPAVPENVHIAEASITSVQISWNAVYGATSYKVYRTTGSITASYVQVATTKMFSWSDTSLVVGQPYYYKVSAISSTANESRQSEAVSIFMPPGNVRTSSITTVSITLEWNAIGGSSGYNIYRSNDENGIYDKVNTDTITGTVFTDTNLVPDTGYYYKTSAMFGDIEGFQSSPISTATLSPIPTNVRVKNLSTISLSIEWNIVNGASGYNIYRSVAEEDGIYSLINTDVVTGIEFTDMGLSPDTSYYYKVSSINNGIESVQSGSILATTQTSVPANLQLKAATTISIDLEWNIVSEASGYNVYRSTSENGTYVGINNNTLTGNGFTDTNLSPDSNYYYRVSAFVADVESELSNFVLAATLSPIPANVRVKTVSTISLSIEWDTVNGASGYNIYRSENEYQTYPRLNANMVTETTFTDTGLSPKTSYFYKISSVNGEVEGMQSRQIYVATLSAIPANVRVTGSTTSSISLTWGTVSETSGYNLYRSTSENGTYTKVNAVTMSTVGYTDTGLSSYTNYYYKVTAIVAGIESGLSGFISAATGTIVPGNGLNEKLAWLQGNAASNNLYRVDLTANESISGSQNLTYYGKSGITIIFIGSGAMRTISITGLTSSFSVGSGVTLILDNNITINRSGSTGNSLVQVNSGSTLIMNTGSKITGNRYFLTYPDNGRSYGGGVYINGGTFTMNGGEISDNCAYYGSGVCVNSGTFTMNGGKITANINDEGYGGGVFINNGANFIMAGGEISANATIKNVSGVSSRGGGVYSSGGSFRMSGGVIYGSNASASLRNVATTGAALYRSSGTAQYGTSSGSTFTSSGNLTTTDTTIRITNGVLSTN